MIRGFVYLLVGVFSAGAFSASVSELIQNKIKASVVKESELGVYLAQFDGKSAKILFELNGEKPLVPASVTKIIPAAAALKKMGVTHQFITELRAVAPVKEGVLKGDLYLKGGGDPSFVSESMWNLVNEFHRTGIKKVEGKIIVDDTLFDEVRLDPSRDGKRVDRAYDAPVGAMSFNWNSVNVFIRSGNKPGLPASIHADPENDMIKVVNRVKTVGAGSKTSLSVHRISGSQGEETVTVSGQISIGQAEKVFYKNVSHPGLWSGAHLKAFLARRGIEVTGKIQRGRAPESSLVLADVESKPLSAIVQDMMKFSNNFVAEMLTKHLSLREGAKQGNMKEGVEALQQYVVNAGLDPKHFKLLNPSGLTQDNKFRPKDLAQILKFIQDDFEIAPEAMASFPLSARDGTLKSRMKDIPAKVRAKTGMLNGVASLAGWAQSEKEGLIVFVFMYNGRDRYLESAKSLFDQILEVLVERS